MAKKYKIRILTARFFIVCVVLINLQAALMFITYPNRYAPWFELSDTVGEATIQGFGVLFIMWNIPYLAALIHPQKNRISLYEALVMQAIGLIGETAILSGLPPDHQILRSSLIRFINFDSAGLLALIIAAFISTTSTGNS